jgi:hypothetical protein
MDGGIKGFRRICVVKESTDEESRGNIWTGRIIGSDVRCGAACTRRWFAHNRGARVGADDDSARYKGAGPPAATGTATSFHDIQYAGCGLGADPTALRCQVKAGTVGEPELAGRGEPDVADRFGGVVFGYRRG